MATFTLPSQISIKKEECIQWQYLKPVGKVVIQLVKTLQVNSKPIFHTVSIKQRFYAVTVCSACLLFGKVTLTDK